MIPPLQIFHEGPHVEITITTGGESHASRITPREAYTLATFADWLCDENEPDAPSTFLQLPDHVAVDVTAELCTACPVSHNRPVLHVAVSVGEGLSDVRRVELKHPDDLRAFPAYLIAAALAAYDFEEPTHV